MLRKSKKHPFKQDTYCKNSNCKPRSRKDSGIAEILYESLILAKQSDGGKWLNYNLDGGEIAQKQLNPAYGGRSRESFNETARRVRP